MYSQFLVAPKQYTLLFIINCLIISGPQMLNRNTSGKAKGIGKAEIMGGREKKNNKNRREKGAEWILCWAPKGEKQKLHQ